MSRIDEIAERARARTIARIADVELPEGVSVEWTRDGVVLSGRGLPRRMLTDLRLRGIGWWGTRT